MTHRQRVGTLVLLAVLGLRCGLPRCAEAVACQPIEAHVGGRIVACAESPIGFCAPLAIATGVLQGTAVFTFVSPATGLLPMESSITLAYAGPLVVHTNHGTLSLSVVGVLDQRHAMFTETQRVTAGTGRFAGATGTLVMAGHLTGSTPDDDLVIEGSLTGDLCLDTPVEQ